MGDYLNTVNADCAFEPDAVEVRCVECEKRTGLMGTCTDLDFCASCKEEFIQGAMHDSGATRAQAESQFSAMLISLIEGAPFKAKYVKSRALHIAIDGQPACGAKGGPHPLTTNPNESNCKRCLTKTAKQSESGDLRSR
jgi:hypothetical protein